MNVPITAALRLVALYSILAAVPLVVRGQEADAYGYTARERDSSGLVYFRQRYYDPALGRFTQRDPVGLTAGINDYVYVLGNPVNGVDPDGTMGSFSTLYTGPIRHTEPLVNEALLLPATLAGIGALSVGAGAIVSGLAVMSAPITSLPWLVPPSFNTPSWAYPIRDRVVAGIPESIGTAFYYLRQTYRAEPFLHNALEELHTLVYQMEQNLPGNPSAAAYWAYRDLADELSQYTVVLRDLPKTRYDAAIAAIQQISFGVGAFATGLAVVLGDLGLLAPSGTGTHLSRADRDALLQMLAGGAPLGGAEAAEVRGPSGKGP